MWAPQDTHLPGWSGQRPASVASGPLGRKAPLGGCLLWAATGPTVDIACREQKATRTIHQPDVNSLHKSFSKGRPECVLLQQANPCVSAGSLLVFVPPALQYDYWFHFQIRAVSSHVWGSGHQPSVQGPKLYETNSLLRRPEGKKKKG